MDLNHVKGSVSNSLAQKFINFSELCLAIDEEISSMIKMFEADMKRLKGILVTYEEKVKDLSAHELE